MQDQELQLLARKYLKGEATEEEIRRLMEWYDDFDKELLVHVQAPDLFSSEQLQAKMLQRLRQSLQLSDESIKAKPESLQTHVLRRRAFKPAFLYAAAAIGLILIAIKLIWTVNNKQNISRDTYVATKSDSIIPGTNKATLTLSDGSRIELDSAGSGLIALQGNTEIIRAGEGQLIYQVNPEDQSSVATSEYNTIATPMGGQYQLVLPDGSKIWLNAASSVTFPTVFSKLRTISVTGEVYLEVAKQYDDTKNKIPFIVTIQPSGRQVEVVGTEFNINAYVDEPTEATTLKEGSVKIQTGTNNREKFFLKPGQQFVAQRSPALQDKIQSLDQTKLENVIAWKNQMFRFDNTELTLILRQVARWYNVEIVYDKGFEDEFFSGSLPRHSSVEKVLNKLELTQTVHFQIDGKKILVKNVK